MIQGPNHILRLPDSSTLVKVWTFTSVNTFDARLWSDGKLHAPMCPTRWAVLRHPATGEVFWRDDCELVAEEWRGEEGSRQFPEVALAKEPTLEDYLFLLERRLPASEDRERTLRIFTWWAWNDPLRDDENGTAPNALDEFRLNLQRLDDLMTPETDPARLMLAEIARELGDYKLSMERLQQATPQKFARSIALMRAANERSDPRVLEVI